jgi:AraC family transcriptional regulator
MQTAADTEDCSTLFPPRFAKAPSVALFPPRLELAQLAATEAAVASYLGGDLVARHQKSWTGVSASISALRCSGDLQVKLKADRTLLSVTLEKVGGHLEIRAKPWRSQAPAADSSHPLSLIPAGVDAYGSAAGISFIRHLTLEFDRAVLTSMLDEEIDFNAELAPRLMFSDAGIMHLAELLAVECTSHEPHSRLYGDTLSVALLLALAKLNGSLREPIKRGQLAPYQLRRVTEYIGAHLAEDIQLQTLADLVQLSRSYFSRAFKMSTGLAPHQWLLQARIAKAKQLLLETDDPIAQIAINIGFVDQAHFTRTFGRAAGESPRAWQRARCG